MSLPRSASAPVGLDGSGRAGNGGGGGAKGESPPGAPTILRFRTANEALGAKRRNGGAGLWEGAAPADAPPRDGPGPRDAHLSAKAVSFKEGDELEEVRSLHRSEPERVQLPCSRFARLMRKLLMCTLLPVRVKTGDAAGQARRRRPDPATASVQEDLAALEERIRSASTNADINESTFRSLQARRRIDSRLWEDPYAAVQC